MLLKFGIPAVAPKDYSKTGYDKGHLAPADDFKRTKTSIYGTFVMTNMAPQKPKLNRQAWKALEERVHSWACGEEKILIITGPVLIDGLPKLKAGISIPNKFFKAVYDLTPPIKSVCFVYTQKDDKTIQPEMRAVSVDQCEKEVGYKFEVDKEIKKT